MSSQRSAASPVRTALIAALGLCAFYAAGQFVPGDFFHRYFWAHPLERISAGMFFVGLTILLEKYRGLRSEGAVLSDVRSAMKELSETDSDESGLQKWCDRQTASGMATATYRRIDEALHYFRGSRREGLEEHLRYLAELASDRLHQTFATIRTITWAIPILGFLGTVIGITMAIANVTPEQLDSSIGEVTQGLSVAFDTTALALGLSIVLVFVSFAVERGEQKVLAEVEELGIEVLLPWFASLQADTEDQPAEFAPDSLNGMQNEIWNEQLTALRGVWSDVLQQHAAELRRVINDDLQENLELNRNVAEDARDTYGAVLQQSAASVAEQFDRVMNVFEDRMSAWQSALRTSAQQSAGQTEALHELGATLLQMAESEQRLVSLQSQLNDNLQALQVAETMERTATSLTAAVHVLTAKTSIRTAA